MANPDNQTNPVSSSTFLGQMPHFFSRASDAFDKVGAVVDNIAGVGGDFNDGGDQTIATGTRLGGITKDANHADALPHTTPTTLHGGLVGLTFGAGAINVGIKRYERNKKAAEKTNAFAMDQLVEQKLLDFTSYHESEEFKQVARLLKKQKDDSDAEQAAYLKARHDYDFIKTMNDLALLHHLLNKLVEEGEIRLKRDRDAYVLDQENKSNSFEKIGNDIAHRMGLDKRMSFFTDVYNELFKGQSVARGIHFAIDKENQVDFQLLADNVSTPSVAKARTETLFESGFKTFAHSPPMQVLGALHDTALSYSMYYWIAWFSFWMIAGAGLVTLGGASFGLAFALPAIIPLAVLIVRTIRNIRDIRKKTQFNHTPESNEAPLEHTAEPSQRFQFFRALFSKLHHIQKPKVVAARIPQDEEVVEAAPKLDEALEWRYNREQGGVINYFKRHKNKGLYAASVITAFVGGFITVFFAAWPLQDLFFGLGFSAYAAPVLIAVLAACLIAGTFVAIKNVINLKNQIAAKDDLKVQKRSVIDEVKLIVSDIDILTKAIGKAEATVKLTNHDLRTLTTPSKSGAVKSFFAKAGARLMQGIANFGTGALVWRSFFQKGAVATLLLVAGALAPHVFLPIGAAIGLVYAGISIYKYVQNKKFQAKMYAIENIETTRYDKTQERDALLSKAKELGVNVKQLNLQSTASVNSTAKVQQMMNVVEVEAEPEAVPVRQKSPEELAEEANITREEAAFESGEAALRSRASNRRSV